MAMRVEPEHASGREMTHAMNPVFITGGTGYIGRRPDRLALPASGIVMLSYLDRYAACCREFRTRCDPHSGPGRAKRAKKYWQPAKGSPGYRGLSPWLVPGMAPAPAIRYVAPGESASKKQVGTVTVRKRRR